MPELQGGKGGPPCRPFNIDAILNRLKQAGLDQVTIPSGLPSVQTNLVVRHGQGGDWGLLAPSIRRMQADEQARTLTIEGLFGADQSKLKVFVKTDPTAAVTDAVPLQIASSADAKTIVCQNIPLSGPGSSGYVVVACDYGGEYVVQSNPVPWSAWNCKFTYTLSKPGDGANDVVGTIEADLLLRGDVHDFRDVPGGPLINQPKPVCMAYDASKAAHYSCAGDFTYQLYAFEWLGEGDVPPDTTSLGALLISGGLGITNPNDQTHPVLMVDMCTGFGGAAKIRIEKNGQQLCMAPASLGAEGMTPLQGSPPDILKGAVEWGAEQGYDIPGNTLSASFSYWACQNVGLGPVDFSARLTWQDATANYPPTTATPA